VSTFQMLLDRARESVGPNGFAVQYYQFLIDLFASGDIGKGLRSTTPVPAHAIPSILKPLYVLFVYPRLATRANLWSLLCFQAYLVFDGNRDQITSLGIQLSNVKDYLVQVAWNYLQGKNAGSYIASPTVTRAMIGDAAMAKVMGGIILPPVDPRLSVEFTALCNYFGVPPFTVPDYQLAQVAGATMVGEKSRFLPDGSPVPITPEFYEGVVLTHLTQLLARDVFPTILAEYEKLVRDQAMAAMLMEKVPLDTFLGNLVRAGITRSSPEYQRILDAAVKEERPDLVFLLLTGRLLSDITKGVWLGGQSVTSMPTDIRLPDNYLKPLQECVRKYGKLPYRIEKESNRHGYGNKNPSSFKLWGINPQSLGQAVEKGWTMKSTGYVITQKDLAYYMALHPNWASKNSKILLNITVNPADIPAWLSQFI
jgi:hypothetical protein